MNKTLINLSSAFLCTLLFSCNKENTTIEKNVQIKKSIDSNRISTLDSTVTTIKTKNGKSNITTTKIQKHEYIYVAYDGTKANITFTNGTEEGNFILIERNKLKIELPQKEALAKGGIYEKDGIKAEAQGDKLTITQNGQVYELERKK